MNEYSCLCRYLQGHPNWEEELNDVYKIQIKREGDLALFKYGIGCDFADPLVQESRGIILNVKTLEVVCWPFRKFGNHNESYADKIDWSTACVQEKVDGSIIKLWYDRDREGWQFSTNGTIRAEEALYETGGGSFMDVICRAVNYKDIPYEKLNPEKTYIFELVSPYTRVVVAYDRTELYHIGTRSNRTGEETAEEIGIRRPKMFPLHSLKDCIRAACALNENAETAEDVHEEGFVVVDGAWNRVKIKSPAYLSAHYMLNRVMNKTTILSFLREDKIDPETLIRTNPSSEPAIRYYVYRMAELCVLADQIGRMAETLYEEYGQDRRLTAQVLKRHAFGSIGFWCLDHEGGGRAYLEQISLTAYARMIPDYEPVTADRLFQEA